MAAPIITQERLRELIEYFPESGLFVWRVNRGCANGGYTVKGGTVAGTTTGWGYLSITIDRRTYRASRLAWFYVHGTWPEKLIDHRDGDKLNNRLGNLREATNLQNQQNMRKAHRDNRSGGLLGVTFHANGWQAAIQANGKNRYLGRFKTAEEAHQCYLTAKRKFHSFGTI